MGVPQCLRRLSLFSTFSNNVSGWKRDISSILEQATEVREFSSEQAILDNEVVT